MKRDTNYFLSSGEEKTEKSAHIFSKQQQTHTNRKKKRREKRVILFSRLMQIKKEKEKRDERDVRSSSSSSSSPFTVLARCHARFRHRFFERVSERNFKSSRVSNVMRFYIVCLLPRFWFYSSSHTMSSFFAHSLSLSL